MDSDTGAVPAQQPQDTRSDSQGCPEEGWTAQSCDGADPAMESVGFSQEPPSYISYFSKAIIKRDINTVIK